MLVESGTHPALDPRFVIDRQRPPLTLRSIASIDDPLEKEYATQVLSIPWPEELRLTLHHEPIRLKKPPWCPAIKDHTLPDFGFRLRIGQTTSMCLFVEVTRGPLSATNKLKQKSIFTAFRFTRQSKYFQWGQYLQLHEESIQRARLQKPLKQVRILTGIKLKKWTQDHISREVKVFPALALSGNQ